MNILSCERILNHESSQTDTIKMKILGLVLNNNTLAIILGIMMILPGLFCVYLFQKKYFSKNRGKIPNSRINTSRVNNDPHDH
jgi:hypothetical protein